MSDSKVKSLLAFFQVKNPTPYTAADVYHATHVDRWHNADVMRNQTIAEHTYCVKMLARFILDAIHPTATCEDKLLTSDYADWHDMPETATGDPSTPLKRIIEKMFKGLGSKESPFEHIETQICPQYAVLASQVKGTYISRLVKLADILDAAKFISVHGAGRVKDKIFDERNQSFKNLIEICKEEYPEHSWDSAYKIWNDYMQGESVSLDFVEVFK
jgi:hypothetical protein